MRSPPLRISSTGVTERNAAAAGSARRSSNLNVKQRTIEVNVRTETEAVVAIGRKDPRGRKQPGVPLRQTLRARKRREATYGVVLIIPALVLVLGIVVVPVIYLAQTSLTNAHAYLPRRDWVGFDNYAQLFTPGSQFWDSLGITLSYALITLVLQILVGIAVALVIHQSFRGRAVIRLVALIPYMIPAVPVALLWRWLLDPKYGAWSEWINGVLNSSVNLLGPEFLFGSLIFVSVWMFSPFVTIAVLARLQTIDQSTLEAAQLDGAGSIRTFFSVILPEIIPVVAMLSLLRFMFMFTKFDIVYLFAGTGANTRTLPVLTFQMIFGESRLGLGSAAAMVMCVILIIFVTVYLWLLGRKKES
jgi:ABC-type sugar transport system permease subunit